MTLDIHQQKLVTAAERLGIGVTHLADTWGMDVVLFEHGGRQELVWKGRVFSDLSLITSTLCDDKHATKQLLVELGIPVPRGTRFTDPHTEADGLLAVLREVGTCVAKPVVGTEGEAVVMDITSLDEVVSYWDTHGPDHPAFLLEQQVPGHDVRVQAIGGRLAAACTRECAAVLGDGTKTVAQLVADRHLVVHAKNPANHLEIDATTLALLRQEGLTPESVPTKGRKVQLKAVANMSMGATAVDITDELHPRYDEWVRAVAARLETRFFSFDLVATDHAQDPRKHARALEVNARAQWLHHTFSERRAHDIPKTILTELFALDTGGHE